MPRHASSAVRVRADRAAIAVGDRRRERHRRAARAAADRGDDAHRVALDGLEEPCEALRVGEEHAVLAGARLHRHGQAPARDVGGVARERRRGHDERARALFARRREVAHHEALGPPAVVDRDRHEVVVSRDPALVGPTVGDAAPHVGRVLDGLVEALLVDVLAVAQPDRGGATAVGVLDADLGHLLTVPRQREAPLDGHREPQAVGPGHGRERRHALLVRRDHDAVERVGARRPRARPGEHRHAVLGEAGQHERYRRLRRDHGLDAEQAHGRRIRRGPPAQPHEARHVGRLRRRRAVASASARRRRRGASRPGGPARSPSSVVACNTPSATLAVGSTPRPETSRIGQEAQPQRAGGDRRGQRPVVGRRPVEQDPVLDRRRAAGLAGQRPEAHEAVRRDRRQARDALAREEAPQRACAGRRVLGHERAGFVGLLRDHLRFAHRPPSARAARGRARAVLLARRRQREEPREQHVEREQHRLRPRAGASRAAASPARRARAVIAAASTNATTSAADDPSDAPPGSAADGRARGSSSAPKLPGRRYRSPSPFHDRYVAGSGPGGADASGPATKRSTSLSARSKPMRCASRSRRARGSSRAAAAPRGCTTRRRRARTRCVRRRGPHRRTGRPGRGRRPPNGGSGCPA